MTLKEFTRYASLHGANLDRWPVKITLAAQDLLDRSQEARDVLADAALTDELLDQAAVPHVSAKREQRVFDRIATRIAEQAIPESVPWFVAKSPIRIAPTAGFLAMMGFLGFLSYTHGLLPMPSSTPSHDMSGVMIVSYLGEIR
ncbi:hypothetical protein [Azospirillum sp.]|uniref:hypothetical protein n=1 Tax=Azospirillum sp. TaxID=34012 RepID=UPI00260C9B70|nr:hypothetical protein [Azospirillum sp.]